MVISVSEVSLAFPNGTYVSIVGGASTLTQFCIVPDIHHIALPQDNLNNFFLEAGGDFQHFSLGPDRGTVYLADGV